MLSYLYLSEETWVVDLTPDHILRSFRESPGILALPVIELPRMTLIVLFGIAKFLK